MGTQAGRGRANTHVAPLADLHVLDVLDAVATERRVHSGEDILAHVELLGRLRDASLRHHRELVKDIRVAVMKARLQHRRHRRLDDGPEGQLARRRELAQRAEAREDVLTEPENRRRICAVVELVERRLHLQLLLHVALLVGVDRLEQVPSAVDDGAVLVVALAVAKHRRPGQLDAIAWPPHTARQRELVAGAAVDAARVVRLVRVLLEIGNRHALRTAELRDHGFDVGRLRPNKVAVTERLQRPQRALLVREQLLPFGRRQP